MSTTSERPAARTGAIGAGPRRVEGPAKVAGTAAYAYEYRAADAAYLAPVQATIARGRVAAVDTAAAEAAEGVLAVLWHGNAPRLRTDAELPGLQQPGELHVLQSAEVHYRGQPVAAVVAETFEAAQHAAALVTLTYEQLPHDAEFSAGRTDLATPKEDHRQGDVKAAEGEVVVDQTYTTPMQHNNPMEPHSTMARWDGEAITLHESTQGAHMVRETVAELLGLEQGRVRVVAPYVGGGFGSKGPLHAPTVLAVLGARAVPHRSVKLAATRRQMFSLVGYRSPTVQRVRLRADAQGRLSGIDVTATVQSARLGDFIEEAAGPAKSMYAAPNRRMGHRAARLDVPVPTWMRAPGECPGMFGPEVAMDELAVACGLDPIEARVRNEPERDPATGKPFSTRNLIACLREGADRFGWADRPAEPGARREGEWLVGTGVAASFYPVVPPVGGSRALVRHAGDGRYVVSLAAADIGTGAWTALTQVAADVLGVPLEHVEVRLGDSALPLASLAGGSTGMMSWGSTVHAAATAFRRLHGDDPAPGAEAAADLPEVAHRDDYAMHAYGAQFAEVRVNTDTGEIRVPRLLGVFAAGRIVNARTARSQFVGGMTMGLSMALHEESVLDARFGHVVNADFAEYHIAANADVADIQAHWIDEHDPLVNPLGAKGIGEIGIVGTAAAVANAAYHATGVRVRRVPLRLDDFLDAVGA
ncbi:xanthine dehydrogenase family protein molybdopterin-binding subunit [Streptomonospora sp. S1-112]|uniref:Xanthine dehydrogenase family protein molybdopterin-binding subunit n=1 Tax=Streptomonospora mangrovi TaxID=2883123 RepID=A0A9X3NH02_9ACTN|nr:xanthine dehydrogenase family protein molybdopterin-binding subunit [Streptomonospora mangrovi]MDA0563452.1 xanthine dehydrogenase family protein molybdopterin-binding subunit [Streptomonospora mangrovi]